MPLSKTIECARDSVCVCMHVCRLSGVQSALCVQICADSAQREYSWNSVRAHARASEHTEGKESEQKCSSVGIFINIVILIGNFVFLPQIFVSFLSFCLVFSFVVCFSYSLAWTKCKR